MNTELTDLSASRLRRADTCMLSYHYRYEQEIPAPTAKARTVFGTVVHNGVERWYGDPGSNQHQLAKPLRAFVDECWWENLPRDVGIALRHTLTAERALVDLEQLICISRPEIKAPRQTKDFVTSKQFKQFEDARDELLLQSARCEEMQWPSDENAFQAYIKSMHISRQLQERWQHQPRPPVLEQEFSIDFAGIRVRGRIDQIRVDATPEGEALVDLTDLKTGKQLMTQMEAFIQAFLYDRAAYEDPLMPTPDIVTFWMARHNQAQHGRIDRERHAKLAERIVRGAVERVKHSHRTPNYGMWCKMCDYRDLCEQEIGMWEPGTDTLVLGREAVAA